MGMMVVSMTGESLEPEVVAGDAMETTEVGWTSGEWSGAEVLPAVHHDPVDEAASGSDVSRIRRGILAMQCLTMIES